LVTQLYGLGTRLNQEIGEIRQVISTADGPGNIGVNVDGLTSDLAALTPRVDEGVTRLQTYYDHCTANIRQVIGNNKAESDQK